MSLFLNIRPKLETNRSLRRSALRREAGLEYCAVKPQFITRASFGSEPTRGRTFSDCWFTITSRNSVMSTKTLFLRTWLQLLSVTSAIRARREAWPG